MKPKFVKKDFKGAMQLYQDFRETKPKKARVTKVDVPTVLMVMGTVEFIGYRTTHKGKAALYKHDFAPGSRPLLCAGPKRNQLFLIEGRYHVTDRGIVDLDAKGREIDDPEHGKDLPE